MTAVSPRPAMPLLPSGSETPAASYAGLDRRATAIVALAFVAALAGLVLLAPTIDGLTARVVDLRSEYSVYEQTSRFNLLLVIVVSLRAATRPRHGTDGTTAILTFLLGFAMYLSESNMIQDRVQPAIGLALGVPILVLLFRARAWIPLLLMPAGFLLIGSGAGLDAIARHHLDAGETVRSLIALTAHTEEFLEVAGTGAIGLAVLLRFLAPVRESVASDRWATACLLSAMGLITAGNSFLHHQYRPSPRLRLTAFGLSVAGFLALVWAVRRFARTRAPVRLVTEGWLVAFACFAFVLLPTVFARCDGVVSIALWPAAFVALGVLLHRHRPDGTTPGY